MNGVKEFERDRVFAEAERRGAESALMFAVDLEVIKLEDALLALKDWTQWDRRRGAGK